MVMRQFVEDDGEEGRYQQEAAGQGQRQMRTRPGVFHQQVAEQGEQDADAQRNRPVAQQILAAVLQPEQHVAGFHAPDGWQVDVVGFGLDRKRAHGCAPLSFRGEPELILDQFGQQFEQCSACRVPLACMA